VGKAKRAHQNGPRLSDGGHGVKDAFAHPTINNESSNAECCE
jgi:hypothetical protein